jgi:hypothetical protein
MMRHWYRPSAARSIPGAQVEGPSDHHNVFYDDNTNAPAIVAVINANADPGEDLVKVQGD